MKKSLIYGLALIAPMTLFGCAAQTPEVVQTQLEIREFQTKSYETTDFKMVMKSAMNVLQDDGYIIQQANLDLGLLTARKNVDTTDKTSAFLSGLSAALNGAPNNSRYEKSTVIDASVNISAYGESVRVRANFNKKKLNNKEETMSVEQVADQEFYQTFFAKVDKGIFIGKEGL